MKYIGTKPWGQNKSIAIPVFAIPKEEIEILKSLLLKSKQHTPRTLETIPTLGRIRSLLKGIEVYFLSHPKKEEEVGG